MELAELKRIAESRRRRELDLGDGRSVSLRAPTRHELTVAVISSGHDRDGADVKAAKTVRVMMEAGVVGWVNLLESDVTGDPAHTDPLAFSAEAVPLLLDAQPTWAERIREALIDIISPGLDSEKN